MRPFGAVVPFRKLLLACCLAVAGCATTAILSQWQSADPGPPFRKLLVVGVFPTEVVRRVFEDEVTAALRTRGLEAVPSYAFIPEAGPIADGRLAEAVRASGADGVLTTRVVRVEQQISVVPTGPAFWGPPWGLYGWYGMAWAPVYAYPPQIVSRDVVYGEVRLYRAATDALVWAASTETFAPSDARSDSMAFARIVLTQLATRKLI